MAFLSANVGDYGSTGQLKRFIKRQHSQENGLYG